MDVHTLFVLLFFFFVVVDWLVFRFSALNS